MTSVAARAGGCDCPLPLLPSSSSGGVRSEATRRRPEQLSLGLVAEAVPNHCVYSDQKPPCDGDDGCLGGFACFAHI